MSSAPLEIPPVSYVQLTKPTEVVVDDENLDRRRQLESIFKSVVHNAISAIKFSAPSIEKNTSEQVLEDVPKTIGEPNEHDSNVVIPCPVADSNASKSMNIATQDPATPKISKRKTSIVIDKQNITFELPKLCLVDKIDMDKLPSIDEENNLIEPMRRLSFRERLTGWSVELSQRKKNDKREKFYHHPQCSKIFRSVNEVVKFILYEDYPGKYSNTKKDKQIMLTEDKGSDMTTKAQRMKKLCMPTSSSVDHRLVQQITTNVVEQTHKDDDPNTAKNVIELKSQGSMPNQVVNMYQSYSQELADDWQKQMVANYHQRLLYQTISSAKLPPGTKTTDNAFHQANALAIIPLSIYKPNEHFSNVTATPNRVVHGTSKMSTSVMVEDMSIKADAPTTERACMSTSNDDMGDKGKGKIDI